MDSDIALINIIIEDFKKERQNILEDLGAGKFSSFPEVTKLIGRKDQTEALIGKLEVLKKRLRSDDDDEDDA